MGKLRWKKEKGDVMFCGLLMGRVCCICASRDERDGGHIQREHVLGEVCGE